MAKTLKQIIDSVKIDLQVFSDDHKLANLDDFIADKIHGLRKTLIRDFYNSNKYVDDSFYQFQNCIEVTCEKKSCTIGNVTVTTPFVVWKAELPKLMTGVAWSNIRYLGLMDYSKNFSRVSFDQFRETSGLWTENEPQFTLVESTILLKNVAETTKLLGAVLLLDTPLDSCAFKVSTDPYPVPSEYHLELLVKKDLLSTWNIPYDEVNDARGTIILPKGVQVQGGQPS